MPNFQGNIDAQPYSPSGAVVSSQVASSSSWWGLAGTIIVFVLILIVAFWFMRKVNNSTRNNSSSSWAKVLDRQVLNGQQSLYLVELAGKLQILASTEHSITKLTDIDDSNLAIDILEDIENTKTSEGGSFFSRLFTKKVSQEHFAPTLNTYMVEQDALETVQEQFAGTFEDSQSLDSDDKDPSRESDKLSEETK